VFCQRCLCRPEQPVSVERLFEDLQFGRVRHFDFFRVQLAVAAQGESRNGIALHQVWTLWNQWAGDSAPARGGRRDGVELGLANLDAWRGSVGRYSFLSEDELSELAEPHFDLLEAEKPGYEWGAYFSRLVMRRRSQKHEALREKVLQAVGKRAEAPV
jgi:hypothetical protein